MTDLPTLYDLRPRISMLRDLRRCLQEGAKLDQQFWLHIILATIAPDNSQIRISPDTHTPIIMRPATFLNPKFVAWDWHGVPDILKMSNGHESLDAALALVERVLPGWSVSVLTKGGYNREDTAELYEWVDKGLYYGWVLRGEGDAASPCLAILLALLTVEIERMAREAPTTQTAAPAA